MGKIIDAVSIVLTYNDEIFAIQRQNFLKAFPGYWAFPGGKVDSGDEENSFFHPLVDNYDKRLMGALFREANEELAIDLKQAMIDGKIERVDHLGLAITPDFNPLRFATYFFRIHLKEKLTFIVDENEAQVHEWKKSHEIMSMYNDGDMLAVPPVMKVYQTLGENPDVREILDLNFRFEASSSVPFLESMKSVRQFMPLSHTLHPANRTNCFLIGDNAPMTLIDPSPKDDAEMNKLITSVKSFGVDQIFLTHHHPDHHERAPELARFYKCPIFLSKDTYERLTRIDPHYFDGIKINFSKEGDVITKWLGRDVVVYEVPGHDEGQLALAPKDMSWFLAGDLFQGIGTVVIGDDEGDMAKYMQTLEKVIALKPKVLYPSHGIALGGTNVLEKTLKHRREREEQVLTLYQEGKSQDDILQALYKDVDQRLWPYALKNIKKHLEKLKKENRI